MKKIVSTVLILGTAMLACGGAGDEAPPPLPPAPPPAAPPPASVDTAPAPAATADQTPAPKSPSDKILATIQGLTDAVSANDAAKAASFYATDGAMKHIGSPDESGRDAIAAGLTQFFTAFPGCKIGNKRILVGDHVAVDEWVFAGTNTGPGFGGGPSTGKAVGVNGVSVFVFNDDGLIKEEHEYFDSPTMLAQLGLSKDKGRDLAALPTSTEVHVREGLARRGEERRRDEGRAAHLRDEGRQDVRLLLRRRFHVEDYTMPAPTSGKAPMVQMFKDGSKAFSNTKMSCQSWAADDFAADECAMAQKMTGPLTVGKKKIPATNKDVTFHGVDVVQLKDGKAVHGWSYADGLEFATQSWPREAGGEEGGRQEDRREGGRQEARREGRHQEDRRRQDPEEMRKTMRLIRSLPLLSLMLVACGGASDEAPPPQPPAPPPAAPAPAPADTTPAPTADTTPPPAPKPPMADMQKAIVAGFASTFGDAAKFAALYAPDAGYWEPGSPEVKGRDAIQANNQKLFDALTNEKLAITRVWAKGSSMAVEWVVTGTQSKDFMGIPGSDKPFGVTGASVISVNDDGLIAKEHAYWDVDTYAAQVTGKGKARAVVDAPTAPTEWHWAKSDATEDANVAAINKQNADWSKPDAKAALAPFADDAVLVDLTSPKPSSGKKDMVTAATAFLKAIPDFKTNGSNVIGVEDFSIDEYESTGTFKNDIATPMWKQKASKKPIDTHGLDVYQWKDGKIVKTWSWSNGMEWDAQTGNVPDYAKPDAKGAKKPDAKSAAKPDATKPDATKPDATKKDATKKDASKK